jgi:hypothetical protein
VQVPAPVPSLVHLIDPRCGHWFWSQLPWGQLTSHLQAFEHLIWSHAPPARQSIEQLASLAQVMSPQALSALHEIVHVQPPGQATSPQWWLSVHSTVHVCSASLHAVQSSGQSCTTQKPLSQIRVPGHVSPAPHVSPSDLRSTVHEPAAIIAIAAHTHAIVAFLIIG